MVKINQPIINLSLVKNSRLSKYQKLDIKCCQLEKENEELRKELENLKEMYECAVEDYKCAIEDYDNLLMACGGTYPD